ncbi:homocitrate synthase [Mycolicibacterium sp. 120266]|uniref:homocitrate synthase n=1 Tax=Mycolicibacterium sp. 120266 TaxID=3090601 RepID=UPI00299D4E88|nr:homocitrate synthase [Mycolicibacterium sp. 120266]MDX1874636.1 homocitrate synthase [Mycolicibacterium sp. 120266]
MTITKTIATTGTLAGPRFADFFDTPLPRGVRELAGDMSWDDVATTFGSGPGPATLSAPALAALAAEPAPIAAVTAMLYDAGIAVELLNFHQLRAGGQTATFIRGTDGARTQWAIGWSESATESALRAFIACANRLVA